MENTEMGHYTHYNIVCEIAKTHLELVQYFVQHLEWPQPKPEFILKWEEFLTETGHRTQYKHDETGEIFYDYRGMGGLSGHWDHKLEWTDNILSVAGRNKNFHFELEYFVQQILIIGLGGTILTCEITNDNMLGIKYLLNGPVIQYTDDSLRNQNICF